MAGYRGSVTNINCIPKQGRSKQDLAQVRGLLSARAALSRARRASASDLSAVVDPRTRDLDEGRLHRIDKSGDRVDNRGW